MIDISRALSPATAVWPGDESFQWSWTAQIENGSSVNVGAYSTSTHAATHADAPLHFKEDGASIDAFRLNVFVGRAQVLDVSDTPVIGPEDVANVNAARVLFKTASSQVGDEEWNEEFPAVAPEAVRSLARQSVVLIGTDAPSVDPVDSTDLPAHHALADCGIVNLENLRLDDVAAGVYRLIALPLKLVGADAAPVRAVLEPARDA